MNNYSYEEGYSAYIEGLNNEEIENLCPYIGEEKYQWLLGFDQAAIDINHINNNQ